METLLLPLLLLAVFYLILIRPQQKQRREIAQLQAALVPGSRVLTGSGLIATIVAIENDEVVLEVAPGVTNRYVRRAVVRVVPDETAADRVEEPVVDDTGVPGGDDQPAPRPVTDRTNRDDGPGTSP